METKVIKPLLRSLFISYALSALFLGALAFALYKLRLGESLVNLLIFAVYFAACFAGGFFTGRKVRNRRFFLGTAVRNVLFSHPFCCFLGYGSRASIQAARSLMVLGVCAFGGTLGGMLSFLRSISSNSSPIRNTRLPKNTKISPRLKITFFSLLKFNGEIIHYIAFYQTVIKIADSTSKDHGKADLLGQAALFCHKRA